MTNWVGGATSAFLSSATWALGVSYYNRLSETYPVAVINFNRALVAFPIFVIGALIVACTEPHGFVTFESAIVHIHLTQLCWIFLSVFSSYALADSVFLLGARILGVPAAMAIAASYPLWSAMAAWFVDNERLRPGQNLGLVLTVGGVIAVILSERRQIGGTLKGKKLWTGVALTLLVSALWALNAFSVSRVGHELPALEANIWRMFLALVFCPFFAYTILRCRIPKNPRYWILTKEYSKGLPIFVIEGFGGALLYLYGLGHAPLALAAALSSLAPVMTIPMGFFFGSRPPTKFLVVGIGLVTLGVIFLVVL